VQVAGMISATFHSRMNAALSRFVFAATCLLVAFDLHASSAPDAQRSQEGTISPQVASIRVENAFGPVRVVGADRDFGWHWTVESRDGKENAEAIVKACQLEVQQTPTDLQLRFVLPDQRGGYSTHSFKIFGFGWSWSWGNSRDVTSHLELRVPRTAAINVKNKFGKTEIAGLDARVRFEGKNGAVDIRDIKAPVTAETSFAKMTLERTGEADLRNQNGDVIAREVKGNLHVTTSFARLEVQDVRGRAELHNQNGTIDASAVDGDLLGSTSFANFKARRVGGKVEVRNQNGRVELGDVHGAISADSSFGDMRVENIGGDAKLHCRNGRVEAVHIRGSVTASNSYAALHVDDVSGDASLDSQNGEVAARKVNGTVAAKTSFAPMELEGGGKSFEAHNQNGPVHITAHSQAVESILASTSFGPLDVRLPSDCKPSVRAATSFGKVVSDFPVVAEGETAATAGPKITLNGRNSDIRIRMLAND
jgi:DUF4097 and DUF4098 domain-containing protein YvlB